jgi:PIN domain nuclease of toxin-antitoxin system
MQPLLLDTCAVVWIAENEKLAPQAIEVLRNTHGAGLPTYVSPITAWEIGLLASSCL